MNRRYEDVRNAMSRVEFRDGSFDILEGDYGSVGKGSVGKTY